MFFSPQRDGRMKISLGFFPNSTSLFFPAFLTHTGNVTLTDLHVKNKEHMQIYYYHLTALLNRKRSLETLKETFKQKCYAIYCYFLLTQGYANKCLLFERSETGEVCRRGEREKRFLKELDRRLLDGGESERLGETERRRLDGGESDRLGETERRRLDGGKSDC